MKINGVEIKVIIEYKDIKNIYLRIIDENTIKITANKLVDNITIIKFINQKAKWITKSIEKLIEYNKNNKVGIINGSIFYLDKKYELEVISCNFNNFKIVEHKFILYVKAKRNLIIDDLVDQEYIMKVFYLVMQKEMQKILEQLRGALDDIISEYNLDKPSIDNKVLKGKWGFCIPIKNRISMNTQLIHFSISRVNEVLWHEYCHLVVPNHSKRFYQLFDLHKNKIV